MGYDDARAPVTAFYDYYHGPNTISFYHCDILLLFTFDPTDPFRILLPSCHGTHMSSLYSDKFLKSLEVRAVPRATPA